MQHSQYWKNSHVCLHEKSLQNNAGCVGISVSTAGTYNQWKSTGKLTLDEKLSEITDSMSWLNQSFNVITHFSFRGVTITAY